MTSEFIYQLIFFLLLAFIAEILGTVGGFGSSVFFVPVAGLFFDFHSVLGITAVFHLSSNVSKIILFKKGIDKKLIFYFGIPAVTFVIAGAFLSKYFNSDFLEICLGAFLILMSVFFLIARNKILKATVFNSFIGGGISGFVAGLLGTGGAIRGVVLAAYNLEKDIFIATSAVIDLAIDISRSGVYFYNGYIQKDNLYLIPFLLLIGFAGSWVGMKILNYVSQDLFKKIVLVLILLIGLSSFLKLFIV